MKAAPRLHSVASTLSSCVELLIQRLFMGICANSELTVFGGNATYDYVHPPAPNDNYFAIDDAYSEWYTWNRN